jgi:hypothetical protein
VEKYSRLNTENVRDTMCLVSCVCGGLANGVDKAYTLKPLVVGELNFANEVVKMCDQAGHDESRPLWHIGTNGIDDRGCEVGVEAVLAIVLVVGRSLCVGVGRHLGVYEVISSW